MNSINFVRYGKPRGEPIIVLHGFPGSAIHGIFFRHFANECGAEIFSLDRPGYGDTPLTNNHELSDWIKMVDHFLTQYGIDSFSVIGISGGTPFALALAHGFSKRVKRLGIICGIAPWAENTQGFSVLQNISFFIYKYLPLIVSNQILKKRFLQSDYEKSLQQLAKTLNQLDQEILDHPEVRKNIIDGMIAARKQGILGIQNDLMIYTSHWKINWSLINMPTFVWFGMDDLMLNYKMSNTFKEKIPHLKLKLFPGEGHFSLPVLHAETILKDFLKRENL